MRRLFNKAGCILFLVVAVGCVTLTPEGGQVRMFRGDPPSACHFVGKVAGSFSWGWSLTEDFEGARVDLFNNTARLGGNFVRVTNHSANAMTNALFGEGFQCPEGAMLEIDRRNFEADPEVVARQMRAMSEAGSQIGAAFSRGGDEVPGESFAEDVVTESLPRSGTRTCGIKPVPEIGHKVGRCINGRWEQISVSSPTTACGVKPIANIGCRIGRCVDGQWEQVCERSPLVSCGIKPILNIGCRIGRCVDGQWEQICN
jgi:Domain of unknown function (DUF4156)